MASIRLSPSLDGLVDALASLPGVRSEKCAARSFFSSSGSEAARIGWSVRWQVFAKKFGAAGAAAFLRVRALSCLLG